MNYGEVWSLWRPAGIAACCREAVVIEPATTGREDSQAKPRCLLDSAGLSHYVSSRFRRKGDKVSALRTHVQGAAAPEFASPSEMAARHSALPSLVRCGLAPGTAI